MKKFGLSENQYQFVKEKLKNITEALNGKAWCWGSRARGDHQEYSDLDIVIELDKSQEAAFYELEEFFQESDFPYKVDLTLYSNLAESYLKNFENDKKEF